jgi:uncharacterized membrane protein
MSQTAARLEEPSQTAPLPLGIAMSRQDKSRLISLTDAVFAILMTILVLGFAPPHLKDKASAGELFRAMLGEWPVYLSYLVAFVVLGAYWVGHHSLVHFMTRVDRMALWLNVYFLIVVSIFPFPAQLLGRFPGNPLAQALYGLNLCVASLCLYNFWRYQNKRGHLNEHMTPRAYRHTCRVLLVPALLYGLGAALACTGRAWPSLSLFAAVPAAYLIPGLLERLAGLGAKADQARA